MSSARRRPRAMFARRLDGALGRSGRLARFSRKPASLRRLRTASRWLASRFVNSESIAYRGAAALARIPQPGARQVDALSDRDSHPRAAPQRRVTESPRNRQTMTRHFFKGVGVFPRRHARAHGLLRRGRRGGTSGSGAPLGRPVRLCRGQAPLTAETCALCHGTSQLADSAASPMRSRRPRRAGQHQRDLGDGRHVDRRAQAGGPLHAQGRQGPAGRWIHPLPLHRREARPGRGRRAGQVGRIREQQQQQPTSEYSYGTSTPKAPSPRWAAACTSTRSRPTSAP
jgi:hypothetical protein